MERSTRRIYAPGLGGLPAMYWYGWMGTAALGALVVADVRAGFGRRKRRGVGAAPAVIWAG
ncbi:MAG TPA: hypothetical protein VE779_17900 [Candidatus Angelobacter sp.]|nr:hypothetical protein [Candidatus Angelobacter sp.]